MLAAAVAPDAAAAAASDDDDDDDSTWRHENEVSATTYEVQSDSITHRM